MEVCNTSETDLTQFDFDDTSKQFTWREYCKLIFYFVAMCLGMIGNTGVILTVVLNRSMRTTINIYLVNLAIADLLICLCCMWVHLVNDLSEPTNILGAVMCKFNGFAQMTCLTSSVLTLSAIACDRFVAILFPLHVRITKQRTNIVIASIWIASMVAAMPFLIYRKQKEFHWRNYVQLICDEAWPSVKNYDHQQQRCITSYPSKQLYYCFVTVCLFFLPVVIMLSAYSLIVWRLWISEMPGIKTAANTTAHRKAKKKVVKLVCVVLAAFIVCWMPLQVIVLYSQFGHSSSGSGELPEWFPDFAFFALYFAYSNSAVNPIIYGGLNHNFRQGLRAIFRCRCHKETLKRPRSKKSLSSITTGVTWSQSTCRNKSDGSTKIIEMNPVKDQTRNCIFQADHSVVKCINDGLKAKSYI